MRLFQIEAAVAGTDDFLPLIDGNGHPLKYTMPEVEAFSTELSPEELAEYDWQAVPPAHTGELPQDLAAIRAARIRMTTVQSTAPIRTRDKRFWTEVSPNLIYARHVPGLTVPVELPAECLPR